MKKLARAFIILGIVLRFWMIVPIVFGVITLRKLDSAKDARELLGWGVVTLFFVSQIAGILLLIMNDEDLAEDGGASRQKVASQGRAASVAQPAEHCESSRAGTEAKSMQSELVELFRLRQEGFIDNAKYEEMRQRILNKYYGDKG